MLVIGTRWNWLKGLGMVIGSTFSFSANCALAQIIPDGTLPNNSNVRLEGNTFNITEGTQAGSNLFHSFREFSVPNSSTAFFQNAADIQNIISRVTGNSISNIEGLIRANGTANLFLINPNGIVFGPNASLNVGGSFVASTANSLRFADGVEFSATNPPAPPLLTVNVPIGLQFGPNPGAIINQSQASPNGAVNSFDLPVGLQVQSGKTLALVGGNVSLQGGNLTAAGGRIELSSVGTGLVNLTSTNQGYAFGYTDVTNFQDIQLVQGAYVDASGRGGGTIQLQGRNVRLADAATIDAATLGASQTGGAVLIQASQLDLEGGSLISASTIGAGQGGSITITAPDSVVTLSGINTAISAATIGTGSAGNVRIDSGKLIVQDGAQIQTVTLGNGRAGDLTVNASDSVELIGVSSNGRSPSGFISQSARRGRVPANGSAGNVTINTGRLIVRDGALISTATVGSGQGGNLTVVAADSVIVSGTGITVTGPTGSSLTSSTAGTGAAGDISINTGKLIVQDGAQILTLTDINNGRGGNLTVTARDSVEVTGRATADVTLGSLLTSRSNGSGNAGNLIINTKQVIIRDGAAISSSSNGTGSGGRLAVTASESIELAGSVDTPTGLARSGLFAPARGIGRAGDLDVSTGRLIIRDGATITVSSTSTANSAQGAGNITLTAPIIRLNNQGEIVAQTSSGNGGNIRLLVKDFLVLRGESQISSTAGTAQQPGDGGNISINTPDGFIIAVPGENSDITANAFNGSGGRITINATDIFGIAPLSREELERLRPTDLDPRRLLTNDITAISQQNPTLNGIIEINEPNVEQRLELAPLATVLVDASSVGTGCPAFAGSEGSKFIVSGRGGLPPSPDEPLSTDVLWEDTRVPIITANQYRSQSLSIMPSSPPQTEEIIPAKGWVFHDNGEVTLVAQAPQTTSYRMESSSIPCR